MNHLFIVGAQRSGSTYLYHLLDSHPDVSMAKPVRPEPKFFLSDDLYCRGRRFYEETYFTAFSGRTSYLGEKSTSYIESPIAARRIRDFYPDARILMILRDPVQRAWSNYRFSRQHQLETLEFEEALAAEPDRLSSGRFNTSVNPYAYARRGHYINYIEAYLTVFMARQLHILILEEIVGSLAAIQNLYRLLGIAQSYVPASLGKVINSGENDHKCPTAALHHLALGYDESVQRLENYLGRQLDVWRCHWKFD
ncbi:MAG TPA: sulfotransferase [Verrucomicrobiae bacterium]|nr:sulfotransferase [Verrucomicrobiae bacterium]